MVHSLFSRHNRYLRLKEDPEYVKKHTEQTLAAVKKRRLNPEFRERQAAYQRRYKKEMKEIAIELGRCYCCYKDKDNPKYKMCSKCRLKCQRHAKKKKLASEESKNVF